MNDIIEAINSRLKAPYFGFVFLTFLGLNWRGFFLLTVTVGSPQERLAAFDSHTSFESLVVYPLIIGGLITLASPWIKFVFNFISQRPFGYMDDLILKSEHKKTIRKTELERSRSDFFANKESELINRAKRDEEVLEIENEKLKEKLQQEI